MKLSNMEFGAMHSIILCVIQINSDHFLVVRGFYWCPGLYGCMERDEGKKVFNSIYWMKRSMSCSKWIAIKVTDVMRSTHTHMTCMARIPIGKPPKVLIVKSKEKQWDLSIYPKYTWMYLLLLKSTLFEPTVWTIRNETQMNVWLESKNWEFYCFKS